MSSEQLNLAPSRRPGGWVRKYPPMATLAVAVFIVAGILPSALNVQQPNPNETAEYAPVPPQDDTPPPSSSFSSIGLTTGGGSKPPEVVKAAPPPGNRVKRPQTKRCVDSPEGFKQTEDPNSPPCVPFFDGDNGGKTFQGVTGEEITVLFYQSTYTSVPTGPRDADPETSPGAGGYCDLELPPDAEGQACTDPNSEIENSYVRILRAYSRYFNDRYQTYGRRVHFHVYWSSSTQSPSSRRSEASDNYSRLRPFAVINNAFFGGYSDDYADAMVRRNVSVFGSFSALPNEQYRKNAPFVWTFWPDVEHWADQYVSYLCTKVAPQKKALYAGEGLQGKDRVYGLLYTSDPQYPGLHLFKDLVKAGISNCPNGHKITWAKEKTFPLSGFGSINSSPASNLAAQDIVADFKGAGVTTVLWLGGLEGKTTPEAERQGYYPEWYVAGDQIIDNNVNGRDQNQKVWRHAVTVTNYVREGKTSEVPARRAFREAEPTGRETDENSAANIYRPLLVLFKSIQVAGPHLSPFDIDRGQHAIPRQRSTNPYVAACFYDPGDYSCVKDAALQWWDADTPDPEGYPNEFGCWRMVNDGRRFLAWTWDDVGEPFVNGGNDPCNEVQGTGYGYAGT